MSLLQMSCFGAVMILAVLMIRALCLQRLPKNTFLLLWGAVLLRLLVPFSLPSRLSVYGLLPRDIPALAPLTQMTASAPLIMSPPLTQTGETTAPALSPAAIQGVVNGAAAIPVWAIVWAAGFVLCALFFVVAYFRCRREFSASLPVENAAAAQWLAAHPISRPITLRQSDRIASPLTYGVLRPVILLPKQIDLSDTKQLTYILAHELIHIKRFDAATKMLLTAALCVHWFNPLVWVMYILANRDLELSCDERVVRLFGEPAKAAYAMALIGMEEQKNRFAPLCNHFSKNAIEQRIKAIMKTKKASLAAALAAVLVVVAVSAMFATSAQSRTDKTFTEESRQMLQEFQFDGYESMTVAAYREKAWALMDQPGYREEIERISQNNMMYKMRGNNTDASFLFYMLNPLTSHEDAATFREALSPAFATDSGGLEYALTLTIADANALTVRQYGETRGGIMAAVQTWLQDKTSGDLQDDAAINEALQAQTQRLEKQWSTSALQAKLEAKALPLETLTDETLRKIADDWEASLSPYTRFGVTYELDAYTGQATLLWNGKQIRGIYDPEDGAWITNSAGDTTFPSGTRELVALYTQSATGDIALSGLREATQAEQAEWDAARARGSENGANFGIDALDGAANPNDSAAGAPQTDTEPRQSPNATAEDYRSLLALKTDNYASLPVAEFNAAVLDWANEDYDRADRVIEDIMRNQIAPPLTSDELAFVTFTARASNEENAALLRSLRSGKPKEDPAFWDFFMKEASDTQEGLAFCRLDCYLSYHIADERALTVAQRDKALAGAWQDIRQFWSETELDNLLALGEAGVRTKLETIAAAHSSQGITLTVGTPPQFMFEAMDERSLAKS